MDSLGQSLPDHFKQHKDGIVITNADGQIVWFNAGFESMCGYLLEEVDGKKPGSFLQGSKTNPALVAKMRAAINAGLPCSVQLVNYHKDGHEYQVHISLTPVRKKDNDIQYFAAIEREFTQEELDRIGRDNLEAVLQADLAKLVSELQRG